MTHTYKITGMTCDGCVAKVIYLLKQLPDVTDVQINLEAGEADITMQQHIATPALRNALKDYPKYRLSEKKIGHAHPADVLKDKGNVFAEQPEEPKSWFKTYKPIILIALYITFVASIVSLSTDKFDNVLFMRVFMSGFFLVFSFFKMLDLRGFANSYAMYDVVAMKFKSWGYVYAFLELALGIAFAVNFEPVVTNGFTAVLMAVSLIGVLQSVFNKKKIQCACLGAVFNLPMSTVTIIEDALMIAMSVAMLVMYL